jgi:sterol-4alpha-carboxylate 3-dehydrogenase (decarboxylating)
MTASRDVFLVLGGDVFVGRHVVERLKARGEIVSVFDATQKYVDVSFYYGDICNPEEISRAIEKVCLSPAKYRRYC